jgi:hypothetical protein
MQMYALLEQAKSGATPSTAAFVSIALSALSAGLACKNICLNFDCDPQERRNNPTFYGYIPCDTRTRMVLSTCLTLNCALLLVARSFSLALLLLENKNYALQYFAVDHAVYILYKIARGDMWYWIPIHGVRGLVGSVGVRCIVKLITDFTGIVQFRHPYELGGAYWTFNTVIAFLFCFYSVHVGAAAVMETYKAWAIAGSLCGVWAITFVVFLMHMRTEYRQTFFSMTTGVQAAVARFEDNADDDQVRASAIYFNRNTIVSIRPQFKAWVLENYARWKEEKPEWFDEIFISNLPDDFIPATEDKREIQAIRNRQSSRRRSSMQIMPA